jgi:ABC-2 type transport system permease protein
MNVFHILRKDLAVFVRDRGAGFYLFVLPLVFILIFTGLIGAVFGWTSQSDDDLIQVPVVNLDVDGAIAREFVERINHEPGYQSLSYAESEAQGLLDQAEIGWYLRIPAGFSSGIAAGEPATLILQVHKDANSIRLEAVQRLLTGIARDLSLEQRILEGLQQMGQMRANDPQSSQAFTTERLIAQAKRQFERSQEHPLVMVSQVNPSGMGESKQQDFNPLMVYVAGFTVLFVFLSAQVTARSFYDEKKTGSFRRLLAAPLRKWELLAGKLLPNLLLTAIQVVVIFAVGYFFLPLIGLGKVTLGQSPWAWAVVSLVVALCSTSLGVFIVSLAQSEAQVTGLSTAVLWVAGILGGSFIPVFMLPSIMSAIGRFTPHYWANQAYYDVLVRGFDLSQVLPSIAVLLAFSAVFFAIGIWKFDFK